MTSQAWATPLAIGAAALLTPLLIRAASRAFPPRRRAVGNYDALRTRYKAVELWSHVFAVLGGGAALWFLLILRPGNTPWLAGVVFGWVVLVPLLFIAVCTLPQGIARWREFWQYYELHHQVNLRFATPVYALFCVLGIISTLVVWHHHDI
jgi:hypothetical protein